MAVRTIRSSVTFTAPFKLKALDLQPAGIYPIETDEEIIEGNEHTVYRRVATLLYIQRDGTTAAITVASADASTGRLRSRRPTRATILPASRRPATGAAKSG